MSCVSAPAAAAKARQVCLLHGGEPLQAADDGGNAVQQPPDPAADAARQVVVDAALALHQERISRLGGTGQSVMPPTGRWPSLCLRLKRKIFQ